MKIKTLMRTCIACPSQWEGWTDDARPVYIRFRHGILKIQVGNVSESIDSLVRRKIFDDDVYVKEFKRSHALYDGGYMTDEELEPYLKEAGFDE